MLAIGQINSYIARHHWHDAVRRQWLRDAPALPPCRQEGAMPHSSNFLLASLPTPDIAALRPHLKTIELSQGMVLFEVGDTIAHVYFPHSGVVSLVVPLESGETIEAAMIGRESLVGGSAGLHGQIS